MRIFPLIPVVTTTAVFLALCSGCMSRRRPAPPPPVVQPLPAPTSRLRLPQRGSPVTGFDRLAGWEVRSETGEVELVKNTDRAIWGGAAAELRFRPNGPGPHRVTLTPDEPWRIQSLFNTILLWVWHDGKRGLRADSAIRLLARDAGGASREWRLPYRPEAGWQMLHLREEETLPWPVRIESLQWVLPEGTTEPQVLFLESLSIYQEVLGRIPQNIQYVRPYEYPPAFAPRRDNSVVLDFPSGPAAFRPQTRSERSIRKVERLGVDRFLFSYESDAGRLGYVVNATPGAPSVDVRVDGERYPGLWRNLGVAGPETPPVLRFARIDDDVLFLQYTGGVHYEVSLHGKTLQVEAASLSENLTSLDLGSIAAPDGSLPKVLYPPFLRLREDRRWPVFQVDEGERTLLVSCFPDWWFSMAGGYEPVRSTAARTGVSLGRMVYTPRWRGSRNAFRERLYFTVSEQLEEVLPSPAAPRALYRDETERWVWRGRPGRSTLEEREPLSGLALIPPEEGVPMGWRHTTVTTGREVFPISVRPVDPIWEDDLLSRDGKGAWREHPSGGYLMKSGRFDRDAVKRVRELRGEGAGAFLFLPDVTAHPPWRYTDFDARMTGAGTYAQTWAETGAFLQQTAAEWGGPVLGGGGSEWLWAGLVAGVVPEFPHGLGELHPFLPHVAWKNIHPYMDLLGLGGPEAFAHPYGPSDSRERRVDRMLASMVAYGAVGRLPSLEDSVLRRKVHRYQQALQPAFDAQTTERIAYWDGARFLSAGEALHTGALLRSRLYMRLKNQTEIWVNGDYDGEWTVRVDNRSVRLPPFGFVVRGEDVLAVNGLTETGSPLSWAETPDWVWISSSEEVVSRDGVTVRGTLYVRRAKEGAPAVLEVSDWRGEARISAERLGLSRVGTLIARDSEGRVLPDVELLREEKEWVLRGDSALRRVTVYEEVRGAEANFLP